MLNILPTIEKKKVLTEYRIRLAIVSIFALGSLILASIVLLIPSYLFTLFKYNNAEKQVAILEEKFGDSAKEKDLTAQIRDINSKIAILNGGATSQFVPSQTILNILKIKDKTIKISGFMFDPTTAVDRIVLAGVARDRDSLANFVDALKKDPTYANVNLPISSYVKSTDIDFSIVLEGVAKKPAKK